MSKYDTLQKRSSKTDQAAEWWNGLTEDRKRAEHAASEKKAWSFEEFEASPKAIREHWFKTARRR